MNRRSTDEDFEFTEVDEIPRIERKIRKKRSTPTTRCVESLRKTDIYLYGKEEDGAS